MNWAKLDAALADAVARSPDVDARTLVVFVEGEGTTATEGGAPLETATVSAREVEELSDRPAVRRLRLARPLGLAGEPPAGTAP